MKLHNFNCLTSITLFYLEKNNIYFKGKSDPSEETSKANHTTRLFPPYTGHRWLLGQASDCSISLPPSPLLIHNTGHIPQCLFLLGNLQETRSHLFSSKDAEGSARPSLGVLTLFAPCCSRWSHLAYKNNWCARSQKCLLEIHALAPFMTDLFLTGGCPDINKQTTMITHTESLSVDK